VNKKYLYLFPAIFFIGVGILFIVVGLGGAGKTFAGIGTPGWGSIGVICLVIGSLVLLRYSRLR
jgi:TM2 domain-containing membrane protein YozV